MLIRIGQVAFITTLAIMALALSLHSTPPALSANQSQALEPQAHTVKCEPPIIMEQGGDVIFTLPALHEEPAYQPYMRGHRLYVWLVEDDGTLGPLRNEIEAGDGPNVIRVQFDDGDADRVFKWQARSWVNQVLIDFVNPDTGKWHFVSRNLFPCEHEGYKRVPIVGE